MQNIAMDIAQQFITASSQKCSNGVCALLTGGCSARLLQCALLTGGCNERLLQCALLTGGCYARLCSHWEGVKENVIYLALPEVSNNLT
jgi:hypothetical protein